MKRRKEEVQVQVNETLKLFDISFDEILDAHFLWLSSKGKEGSQGIFMNINFQNFNFTKFEISGAVFKNCNLSGAKFGTNLEKEILGLSFSFCNLSSARFASNLSQAKFEECNLSSANFEKITITDSHFTKCFGEDAIFIKSIFQNSFFKSSKISNANFNSAKFLKSDFKESHFPLCDFAYIEIIKSNILNSDFLGTDFHSAIFTSSKIENSKFSSLVSKKTKIKTSLDLVKFINCNFKACTFEETEKSLKEKIIKTTLKKNATESVLVNRLLFATITGNAIVLINTLALPFLLFYKTSILNFSFFSLSLFIFSSFFCITLNNFEKTVIKNGKIPLKRKGLKTFFAKFYLKRNKKLKAFILTPQIILGLIWFSSLKYENFTISFILLSLFFASSSIAFFATGIKEEKNNF